MVLIQLMTSNIHSKMDDSRTEGGSYVPWMVSVDWLTKTINSERTREFNIFINCV